MESGKSLLSKENSLVLRGVAILFSCITTYDIAEIGVLFGE